MSKTSHHVVSARKKVVREKAALLVGRLLAVGMSKKKIVSNLMKNYGLKVREARLIYKQGK